MRLIDADAFERAVMFSDDEDLLDVIYRLRDFPTIEPERKTGRWIFIRPTKEDRLYVACDQCGQAEAWDENCGMLCALLGEKYAHYCPNCGAYMGSKE